MNSKELVTRAIEMKGPNRVPVFISNNDNSDSTPWRPKSAEGFIPNKDGQTEWGFVWESIDKTIGQPKENPLADWNNIKKFNVPNANAPGRFEGLQKFIEANKDKYILGKMGITGFNLMTFIRGFSDVLEDLYFEKNKIATLADMVFGFEEGIIRGLGYHSVDAVTFYDDWGTQNSLMINPKIWREFFKPRYRRQFDIVHSYGMHVYFHSCGYCYDIIGDLIDIGVDMLNLNQPNIFGIEKLGKEFGGKICFVCPVDIQTTSISGNKEEIYSNVKLMIDNLGCYNGGFIGLVENYYEMGFISNETQNNCIQAFYDLGMY